MSHDLLLELERRYPGMAWRKPLPVLRPDGEAGLACRVCIHTRGLAADEIAALPRSLTGFDDHMREFHRAPAVGL